MGTHIKLGVSACQMVTLKAYLTGKDGADYIPLHGFYLSLSCASSGKCAWDR